MRKMLFLLFTAALFSASAQKTKKVADRFAGLDAQLEKVRQDWKAAGFAVAVVEKDRIVYSKGFGYRNWEEKLPVTTNTLFAIGSVTKSFTSSLIGLLQKDGKVDYDKPAHSYLPALSFYNDALNNDVTLRHMMSHQTGLPRHDFSWYFFPTSSRDSMLQRVRYQEPTAGVRAKWQYNNFMFTAQGVIAEKLMGKPWEDAVRTSLLQPLGMTRTNFSIADLEKSTDASIGYGLRGDSAIRKLPYHPIDAMGPAGSINSSVTEMAAWLTAWINGGKYQGKEVLPLPYVSEAITPQAIVSPGLPSKEKPDLHFSTYGFGWMMSSYRGHYRVEHGGNIDGFSASAAFYPTDSIGIVVLTNQNGSAIPSIVRNILSDRLLNLQPYDWSGDMKKIADKGRAEQQAAAKTAVAKTAASKPTHAYKDFEGSYAHPGYGSLQVFTSNDSLYTRFTKDQVVWLKHNNYNVFDPYAVDKEFGIDTVNGKLPMPVQFRLNLTGEVESFTAPFESGLEPLVFKKQPNTVAVASVDLKKYEGDYTLSGTTVKVYTKAGTTLYVFVPGQPEYELLPQEANKFALKAVSGYYVQFGLDEKGAVKELTFIQPNGNFKAVRKS
ncbi:serine hydrolase [Flavisolibacter sp. BT320]|nr:serine hydrolase [Flavisolibacter longurius]